MTVSIDLRFKKRGDKIEIFVRSRLFISSTQRIGLLATNAVQGEKIGNLNIPAVLEYRVKTTSKSKLTKVEVIELPVRIRNQESNSSRSVKLDLALQFF